MKAGSIIPSSIELKEEHRVLLRDLIEKIRSGEGLSEDFRQGFLEVMIEKGLVDFIAEDEVAGKAQGLNKSCTDDF